MAQAPSRAYLAPAGTPLQLEYDGTYARVALPLVQGHAIVVVE